MHCETSACFYWMSTELVYWSMISDKRVTLVSTVIETRTTKYILYYLAFLINATREERQGSLFVLPTTAREQATSGHSQSNAALIVFLYLLNWSSVRTQCNQPCWISSITGLCEATAVRQANLATRKAVRATFTYPQYWWSNHIEIWISAFRDFLKWGIILGYVLRKRNKSWCDFMASPRELEKMNSKSMLSSLLPTV